MELAIVVAREEGTVLLSLVAHPDEFIWSPGDPGVAPLRETDILALARIVGHEDLCHLSEVVLPHGFLLVDHIVVGLIAVLDELSAAQIEHADSRAFRRIALVTDFQSLRSFEGFEQIAANVLSVIVGIPCGTPLLVVVTDDLVDIDLATIHQYIEGEGRLAVLVVLVLGRILVLALELEAAPKVTTTDRRAQAHAIHFHVILLLQLLHDGIGQWCGFVPF